MTDIRTIGAQPKQSPPRTVGIGLSCYILDLRKFRPGRFARFFQVVICLQPHPELLGGDERARHTQCSICGYSTFPCWIEEKLAVPWHSG